MKAVILAGGAGTRLSEETQMRPKPMVEIGGKPILWHIMKSFSSFGINDFVICLGYKGYLIKEYFTNYRLHNSNVTIDLRKDSIEMQANSVEPWHISLVDTGEDTLTGGRIRRIRDYVKGETFLMTYGDGVADINIDKLLDFHRHNKRWATVTAVHPQARFGALDIEGAQVKSFIEKPDGDGGLINGGFFVLEPEIFDLIDGDSTIWERTPMEKLAAMNQLSAYTHHGFWRPMDTLRDKTSLEELWKTGKAPWRNW